MKLKITVLIILFPSLLIAQDTLTLAACLEDVVQNSPRLRDKGLIDEQGALKQANIKTNWYPQLTVNGKLSYQSDVVSIEISDPAFPFSFPDMPHEQFGLNLDMKQTIYDGGLARQQKQYESALTAAELQKVEVDLHALKEKVSSLFFSILVIQENRKNLEVIMDNLKSREAVLLSAIENGIAMEADLQVIRVEILKVLQSMSELDAARNGALKILSVYMGKEFSEDVSVVKPFLEIDTDRELIRPELSLFTLQAETLEAGKELAGVKRLPLIYAFGQAGLGMPGYNMLNDEIDSYYMIGAGLRWNIWDWNKTKREKQILETRKQQLMHTQESFTMNIRSAMDKEIENMEHFRHAVDLDKKMLEMRMDITRHAASQLENGVISATDYVQHLNEENITRIKASAHELKLLHAIASYRLLQGTL